MHEIFSQFLLRLSLAACLQLYNIHADRAALNKVQNEVQREVSTDAQNYLQNGKYYTPDGNLIFYGGMSGFSDDLTLFFKEESSKCARHFKITFCLDPPESNNGTSDCPNGIVMCYDSQITASYMKEEYRKINLKKNPDLICKNGSHMALKVATDFEGKHFIIHSSLDRVEYKFAVPEMKSAQDRRRCFDLNMGSSNSIATTITKINNANMLVSTGDPPAMFEEAKTFSSEENKNNLWMLFADFMPYYLKGQPYYPRPIQFTGGGSECFLSAEFNADSLHICKRNEELIGTCEPHSLDSSDAECTVELGNSESQEEEKRKEHSQSETSGTSDKDVESKGGSFDVGGSLTLGATAGIGIWSLKGEVTVNTMWGHTWSTSKESERTKSNTNTDSESTSLRQVFGKDRRVVMKIHRTDGGTINFYQQVLECGGKILRYHKIIARGDAEHTPFPQSTTVYEWRNDSAVPQFHHTIVLVNRNLSSMEEGLRDEQK